MFYKHLLFKGHLGLSTRSDRRVSVHGGWLCFRGRCLSLDAFKKGQPGLGLTRWPFKSVQLQQCDLHPDIYNQYKFEFTLFLMFDVSNTQWLRSLIKGSLLEAIYFYQASLEFCKFHLKWRMSAFKQLLYHVRLQFQLWLASADPVRSQWHHLADRLWPWACNTSTSTNGYWNTKTAQPCNKTLQDRGLWGTNTLGRRRSITTIDQLHSWGLHYTSLVFGI